MMKEYAARRQEILAEVRKRTSKNLGGVAGEYKGVELDCRKVHLAFSKIFVAAKSPIATMAIVSLLWLGVVFGCTPRGRIDNSSTKTEYKHGSKIIVRYNSEQNKTFFYQDDIKISPLVTEGSEKVSGKHEFEISSSAEGRGMSSPPAKVTLTLLHDTPTKTGWRYPRPTKFAFVANGQRFELLCEEYDFGRDNKEENRQCSQSSPLKKDDPSDADYYEALFMELPFQTFVTIGNAQAVQVQIGTANFNLPAETILAFRDFGNAMSRK